MREEENTFLQISHQLTDLHKDTPSAPTEQDEHLRSIKIPLILKRMNSVQKYVSAFSFHTAECNKSRQDKPNNNQNNKINQKGITPQKGLFNHSQLIDASSLTVDQDELTSTSNKFCLNYSSMAKQKTEQKLQVLGKLQKDYLLLKRKMQTHIKHLKSSGDGQIYKHSMTSDISEREITAEEVQKQLKNSIINEDGRKYYADLYLLKKGRDKIMNSLSNVGKISLQNNSHPIGQTTHEEKLKSNEEDYVKDKIIRQRQAKKAKMMKGRNLHWNVYYDMLALSANEKKRLKGICKFTSTFGIA